MSVRPPARPRFGVARLRKLALTSVVTAAAALAARPAAAQTAYTWNGGATTGSSNAAWFTTGNWTSTATGTYPGSAAAANPGTAADVAVFGPGTATSALYANVGVTLNAATPSLTLAAISVVGTNTLVLGNSSGSANLANRFLILKGAAGSLGGLADNTILSATGGDMVIQGAVGSGVASSPLLVQLGTASGVITASAGRTVTISTAVTDGGNNYGFTFTGGGTLVLTGANTYTGATTIAAGAVRFGSQASVGGLGKANVTATNATVAAGFAADQLFVQRVATASTGTFAVAASNGNDLDLSRFAGLSFGAAGGLTNAPVLYSGTLTQTGTTYRLGGGGGVLGFDSVLSSGAVSVVAGGTVAFTRAMTYTGGTTVAAGGTLQLGAGGSLGSLAGGVANSGTVAVNRAGPVLLSDVVGGAITGTGGLTQLGAGTLTVEAAQGYTGATTVAGNGTLTLNFTAAGAPATNLIAGGSPLAFSNGTLAMTVGAVAASQTFASTTVNTGGNNLVPTITSGSLAVALGTVTQTTGSRATLNVATPAGTTATAAGTTVDATGIVGPYLTVGGADWGTVSGNNLIALPTASYTPATSLTTSLASTANVRYTGGNTAVSGTVTINTLRFTTGQTITITNNSASSQLKVGGILVPAGISAGFGGSTANGGLASNGTDLYVYTDTGATLTVGTALTGSYALTKAGPGTMSVTVTGASSFTGPIYLNEGVLAANRSDFLGSTGTLFLRGGTVRSTGTSPSASGRPVAVEGNATFDAPGTASALQFGSYSGTGTLTKTGTLSLILSNVTSPFSGTLVVANGLLTQTSSGGSLPSARVDLTPDPAVPGSTSTLNVATNGPNAGLSVDRLTGTGTVVGVATGTGTVTAYLYVGGANGNSTFGGLLKDNSATSLLALAKVGTGTLVLNGTTANAYTGGTSVAAGVLQFNDATLIGGNTANVAVGSGGAVAAGGTLTAAGLLTRITAASTGALALTTATNSETLVFTGYTGLSLGAVGLVTYSGALTLNGTVTRLGGGGGTLTYTPAVSTATLAVAGPGKVVLTGPLTGVTAITNAGELAFSPTAPSAAVTANISGVGIVQKLGPGTVTLSGTNTHTGGTVVTAGTLELTSAAALPTLGDVVLAGGTLKTTTGTTTAFQAGSLRVIAASSLTLDPAAHTLTFSSGLDATGGGSLTVYGWAGSPGGSGTAGQIVFLTTGLNPTAAPGFDPNAAYAAFLPAVTFDGTNTSGATFIMSGANYELVPATTAAVPEPATAVAFGVFGLGLAAVRRRSNGTTN